MIYSDKELSQKIERAEASSNARFVEARARYAPALGAEWMTVGGAYAMFDGAESPTTQTFGLGLFDEITDRELEQLETFFKDRGAPVFHEVSPMAPLELMMLLNERGYQPIELSSILYRPVGKGHNLDLTINLEINIRIIDRGEEILWAQTSAEGWGSEMAGLGDFMLEYGRICAGVEGGFPFLAELEGKPVSTGMLFIHEGVALLAGASTIPDARRQGAQIALLDARLRFAAEHDCRIATMGTLPGSQSQRNAQKNGFLIAYTRTKWQMIMDNG